MTSATVASAAALDDYAGVSDPSGEPIAVWERVSTDMTRQDIASQTRDLKAFISAGAYRVVRVFRFEASAFHGEHTDQQAEMIADIEASRYRTVVAAMSSRYERRGWQYAMFAALQLHMMGARIVAIDDDSYGDMSSELGGIATMFKAIRVRWPRRRPGLCRHLGTVPIAILDCQTSERREASHSKPDTAS